MTLVKGGFVEGLINKDGELEDYDVKTLDFYVCELIKNHLFSP
jgi:hypothetical protein